ncbi:hypothetical protein EON67_04340 [archaeon]|nr:MAG: hypothetical protein EON67_04340 [archaeon]
MSACACVRVCVRVRGCRYDIMNDVMSGTLHRLWKDEFVHMVGPVTSSGTPPLTDQHVMCARVRVRVRARTHAGAARNGCTHSLRAHCRRSASGGVGHGGRHGRHLISPH